MTKEPIYKTIDSDKLIERLKENDDIELLGIGSRYDSKFPGMHSDKFKCDNTYNWEITDEDEDGSTIIYSLSNNFEIRENDDLLIISKHISEDIRGGYEDDMIYVKNSENVFYSMILENAAELAVIDK